GADQRPLCRGGIVPRRAKRIRSPCLGRFDLDLHQLSVSREATQRGVHSSRAHRTSPLTEQPAGDGGHARPSCPRGAGGNAGVVLFTNASGGPDTATIASAGDWSSTLIVTTVPAGAATGNLVVKTSGGTSTPVVFTLAAKVAVSPSTVAWTSTTALSGGLSGHAVAAATLPGATPTSAGYVVGCADRTNTPRDSVQCAAV